MARKKKAMIHVVRAVEPSWPVEEGRTRSTIAGWCVEWSVTEPTQAEVEAIATPTAAQLTQIERDVAKALFLLTNGEGISKRVVASILLDEINSLRQWITDFKAAVAGAATLAALKTAVAALPNMPARTMGQAKTAYNNRADDGTVDS